MEKHTKRRIDSKDLWKQLTNGKYKEIIEFAALRKNDLDIQIRDNYLNIYYRGGNILRIHPRSLFFDEFYFHTGVQDLRKTHLLRKAKEGNKECLKLWDKYKKERDSKLNLLSERGGVERYFEEMKKIMDKWEKELNTIQISHDEKNEQQLISMNNRGNTPYTVVDLEYSVSRTSSFKYNLKDKKVPRFDIIAVDKEGQLYVIELKTGLGAIENESGIKPHMDCFNHTIGRDTNSDFIKEMADLLQQKKNLKLIDNSINIDLKKNPKFLFAFSDKKGEDKYMSFVQACRNKGYKGEIIYLDNSHILKKVQ